MGNGPTNCVPDADPGIVYGRGPAVSPSTPDATCTVKPCGLVSPDSTASMVAPSFGLTLPLVTSPATEGAAKGVRARRLTVVAARGVRPAIRPSFQIALPAGTSLACLL